MGFLGGLGNSSSASKWQDNSTTNTYTAIDKRIVADGGSSVISIDGGITASGRGQVNFTTTDFGAVQAGKDIAIAGLNTATIQQANALSAMSSAIADSQVTTRAAQKSVSDTAGAAMGSMLNMGVASTQFAAGTMDNALGFAGSVLDLQKNQQALVEATQSSVSDAYKTANDMSSGQRVVVIAALAVVGIAAVMMVSKRRAA